MNETLDSIVELNNAPDTTSRMDPMDVEQNKLMAVLAYLSWLVLIPIIFAPNSRFARFHANQGLVLAIVEIVCGAVLSIFGSIPLIGWLFQLVGSLFSLVCLLIAIIGIVNAVNGKAKQLPVVGAFTILK